MGKSLLSIAEQASKIPKASDFNKKEEYQGQKGKPKDIK